MLRWFEHRQVYIPTKSLWTTGEAVGRPWQDVYFQAEDGTKLNGWYFQADQSKREERLAVLICHGNAGNISHRLDLYQLLLGLGLDVFAFDYRGYGRSEGIPCESGTYEDAAAACQWLQSRGYPLENILVLGESLGGGVGSELARRFPVRGLILQSTFISIPELGSEIFPWLPVKWLCTIRYDTLSKLPSIRSPVLVLHSREDTLIGFHHAEALYAAASEPKMLRELSGDHNASLLLSRDSYREAIVEFLRMAEEAWSRNK